MISIMLVDDHPIIRRGLKYLLEGQPDFKVVGETGNGFEALQMIEQIKPKVAMLDLMIEGLNGIEVAKRLGQAGSTAIIVFSVLSSDHYVMEALRAGVRGYILKESPTDEVIHAIHEVAAGKKYLCSQLQEKPNIQQMAGEYTPDLFSRLTNREREVLQCSLMGNTCAEIAEQLNISRRTVEAHRANMMRKLGLSSLTSLYRYAFQQDNLLNQNQYPMIGR